MRRVETAVAWLIYGPSSGMRSVVSRARIAFSIPRRADRSFFSSAFAASLPLAASRRRCTKVAAVPRSRAARPVPGRGPGLLDESAGWRTVSPAAARCIAHPGPPRDDERTGAGRGPDGLHLPGANLAGQLGFGDAVRAAGPAAEPVVVGLAQPVGRAEHRADGPLGVLDVAKVARVLHHDRAAGLPERERPLQRDPFGEVAHPLRERGGLGRADEAPVVLHRRAATGAVDHEPGGRQRIDDRRARCFASLRPRAGGAPSIAPPESGRDGPSAA